VTVGTDLLLALPILVPLTAAAVALVFRRSPRVQRALGVAGAAGLLAASVAVLVRVRRDGILATDAGGWAPPYGITLVADLLSAILLVVTAAVALAVVLFAAADLDRPRQRAGFYPLVMTLMLGVSGAFLSGDLFNLYVWFEVLLISSFVLLALGGEERQMKGAIRYFVLNLLSSALFLAALGILYGKVHTLNLADLAAKAESALEPELLTAVAVLFLCAFGLKAAVFPLFFWLPASYPAPPPAVSALFAGLLTKVGVYALLRVFTLLFVHDAGFTHTVILWIAGASMVVGVLGAVAQTGIRRILSFHIVSQIGYMLMGLGLLTPLALAGSVFYLVHHIVVKTNLFLIGGAVRRLAATGRLERLGGLAVARPGLTAIFAVAACALGVSLLTLLSMSKIWNEAFWKPAPEGVSVDGTGGGVGDGRLGPVLPSLLGLTAVTVAVAVCAGPLFELAADAAHQLLDRDGYVAAVLGAGSAGGGR
jgi:multicomponent Na+:H+ antiporter subunit D